MTTKPQGTRRSLPTILPTPHDHQREPEVPRPRKAPRVGACNSCRARKTKCDGVRPRCLQCTTRDTVCRYVETAAKEMKRTYRELQNSCSAHKDLLNLLKTMSESDAMTVLRMLKTGSDVNAILNHIKDGNVLKQMTLGPETRRCYDLPYFADMPAFILRHNNSYLKSPLYQSVLGDTGKFSLDETGSPEVESKYLMPCHAAEFVDPLLSKVTISKWTSVITDNTLFREILGAFFQNVYPDYVFFHKDSFLEDMALGRTQHCSSLLVNAVLAAGYRGYKKLTNRNQFWLPMNLGYLFTAEAKRIWEFERPDKVKLTTIQAAMLLHAVYNLNGIDRLGETYLLQALSMAREIRLFDAPHPSTDSKTQQARTLTAWSLFNWQVMMTFYFFRLPFVEDPPQTPLPDPTTHSQWFGDIWVQYPGDSKPTPSYLGHTLKARLALRTIMNDMSKELFKNAESAKKLSLDQLLGFKSRLDAWFDNLPGTLTPGAAVFPTQLELHLEYHSLIMRLFQSAPVINTNPLTISALTFTQSSEELVTHASASLETIFRLKYIRHGFDNMQDFFLYFCILLGNMAIESLSALRDIDEKASNSDDSRALEKVLRQTLILCTLGLQGQGQSLHLANVTLRALQARIDPIDLHLVQSYCKLTAEADQDLVTTYVQSTWPIPIIKISDDPDKAMLDNLLSATQDLAVEDDGMSVVESEDT